MKNKRILKIGFIVILALTILLSSVTAFADEVGEEQSQAEESYVLESEVASVKESMSVNADLEQEEASFEKTESNEAELSQPSLVSAISYKKGIKITWKSVEDACKYYIYRKDGKNGWVRIGETEGLSYIDNACDKGVVYRYTVKAVFEDETVSSCEKPGLKAAYVPRAKVTRLKNKTNGITINWNKVKIASGYTIYRKEEGTSKWTKVARTAKTSYTDTSKLSNGKVYEYAVKAYVTLNGDKYYSCISNNYILEITRMSAPKLIKAKSASTGAQITWNAMKGASKYAVCMKAGSRWIKIGTTTKTSFVYKSAPAATSVTYTVVAIDSKGNNSAFDSKGVYTIYIPITKITTIENKVEDDDKTEGVYLTWKKSQGASAYKVYRKVKGGSWKLLTITTKRYYMDTGKKKSGKNYVYSIRPFMTIGSKTYASAHVSSRDKTIMWLESPQLSKVICKNSCITLKWNAVTGAAKYRIYRKTSSTQWKYYASTTSLSYKDTKVETGTRYYYTVKAMGSTDTLSGFHKEKLSAVYYPTDDYRYYELPSKRYLNLGWNVDPRDSWGPADYCKSPTTYHGTLMTNSNWWTYHGTYYGDTYKPQAGDIITYGIPDSNGDTKKHVDICVKSYDSKTGTFGVVTGNWGYDFTTSPIAYTEKDWDYYTSKLSFGSNRICNIWECKLSTTKKDALVNTAWGMYYAYQKSPNETRNLILSCKWNNWCDVFVSYVIYVAR